MSWQDRMRPFFTLFVVIHLLIDLAMPSLPGAFRFNPDESAVGVRVEPIHAQNLKPALRVDLHREAFELPRLQMVTPVDLQTRISDPELIVLLPRRDPSSDRSVQLLTEAD